MCIFALAAGLFGYGTLEHPVVYEIVVGLEGSLPMMAGEDKKAEVKMAFQVSSAQLDGERATRFTLDSFVVGVLDSSTNTYQPLPLSRDAAKDYFPDTTIRHDGLGKLGATTPKAKPSPFRLPGVDTESLPAMTFLALEFPAAGVEEGKPWNYSRLLLGQTTAYEASYRGKDKTGERFELSLKQEGVQGSASTRVEGHGTVWFDQPVGKITKGELSATVVTTTGTSTKPKTVKMKVSIGAKVK